MWYYFFSHLGLIVVGKYKSEFNSMLGLNIEPKDIYRSKGLPAHMLKSKHGKCLKYIDYIPDIIDNPDYIGINPNESGSESIELIKRYRDNVMIGIKLDKDNDYLYVSTMHGIQESKNQRRLHSGRSKNFRLTILEVHSIL
nr:PBECR2 nuclease fold domain-containing protein [uncultured Acetatifactor sp.]